MRTCKVRTSDVLVRTSDVLVRTSDGLVRTSDGLLLTCDVLVLTTGLVRRTDHAWPVPPKREAPKAETMGGRRTARGVDSVSSPRQVSSPRLRN